MIASNGVSIVFNNPATYGNGIVLVCGTQDTSVADFNANYVPELASLLSYGARQFLMGNAKGVDQSAQNYLRSIKCGDEMEDISIFVCQPESDHHAQTTKITFPTDTVDLLTVGDSYSRRDRTMFDLCSRVVAFLPMPFGFGSSTFAMLIRAHIRSIEGYDRTSINELALKGLITQFRALNAPSNQLIVDTLFAQLSAAGTIPYWENFLQHLHLRFVASTDALEIANLITARLLGSGSAK